MSITKTISQAGETRTIKLSGNPNSKFEIYVKQGSNYYNFDTDSFTPTINILKNQSIPSNGLYTKDIIIPSVTSNTSYDFFVRPIGETKLNVRTTPDQKIGTLYQKGTATATFTTTDDTTLSIHSDLTGATATKKGKVVSQTGAVTEASGNLVYIHSLPTWDKETGGAWTNSRTVQQEVQHGSGTVWYVDDGTNIVSGHAVVGDGIIDEITVSAISGNKVTLSAAQDLEAGQLLTFSYREWIFSNVSASVKPTSGTTSVQLTNNVTVEKVGIGNVTVELDIDEYISVKPNAFPVNNVKCPAGTAIEIVAADECTNYLGELGDNDANVATKTFKVHSIPSSSTTSTDVGYGTLSLAADATMTDSVVAYTPAAGMVPGDTDYFYYKTVDAQSTPVTSSLTQGKISITIV